MGSSEPGAALGRSVICRVNEPVDDRVPIDVNKTCCCADPIRVDDSPLG